MDNAGSDLNVSQICRVCLQAEDSEIDRALFDIFSEERGVSLFNCLLIYSLFYSFEFYQ